MPDLCNRCKKVPPTEGRKSCAKCREYVNNYLKDHPQKRSNRKVMYSPERLLKYRAYNKECRDKLRSEVLQAYGGRCACCGEAEEKFLTIDHKDNNGASHRKEIFGRSKGTGTMMYRWLRDNGYPDAFQVLCWNCNCAKGHYGVCPHES